MAGLQRGEEAVLGELDPPEQQLAQAFRLHPGGPFYLAAVFRDIGRPGQAEAMLRLQWRRGRSPWREEAGLELLGELLEQQRYPEAQGLAGEMAAGVRDPELRARAERGLVEALYWQSRDAEVLSRLQRMERDGEGWDGELELFRAVSSCRLARPGWEELFRRLFFSREASALHTRAYLFLDQQQKLGAFPSAESAYFHAKDLLYRGQSSEALQLLEAALPELPAGLLAGSPAGRELATACFAVGAHDSGAHLLLALAERLSSEDRLDALEMAGRLYRKQGSFPQAEQLLRQVMQETESSARRDRAIWFVLDMARASSGSGFLRALSELAPQWREPAYFADILGEQISGITARSAWQELWQLEEAVGDHAPAAVSARLSFILGRALELHLLEPDSGTPGPGSYYRKAAAADGGGYYGLLASAALGAAGGDEVLLPAGEGPEQAPSSASGRKSSDEEQLVQGYLDFGLERQAYERLLAGLSGLPRPFVLDAVQTLQERGEVLLSLRLMAALLERGGWGADPRERALFYPRGYRQEVEGLSAERGIPPALFFALVREESHFDPEIVSASGAVGLTQLMSDAAQDAARRLRLESFDLRDPGANLSLGSDHFSRLLDRLADPTRALMAYNAGLSRLRGWERRYAPLPTEMLVEAIPFPETRAYVRKVLVSAVHYGALYYGRPPAQTLFELLPELRKREEDYR
jgi:hypothetical protein